MQECYNISVVWGAFQQTARDFISLFSNLSGGLHFNNMVILLGLFQDSAELDVLDLDLIDFVRLMVEDDSVSSSYKEVCLSQLYFYYNRTDDIHIKNRCVPSIVPQFGFNDFLDGCISDAFSGQMAYFSYIWNILNTDSKVELLEYMGRVSSWKRQPAHLTLHLENSPEVVIEKLGRTWLGLTRSDRDYDQTSELEHVLTNFKISHMGRFVEGVEVICWHAASSGDGSGLSSILDNILGEVAEREICAIFGKTWYSHLLINLVASPNVDAVVSTLALLKLVMKHGLEPLGFEDRFPRILVRRKCVGVTETYSVLEGLVEAIRLEIFPAILLLQILHKWEERIFLSVATSHFIDELGVDITGDLVVLKGAANRDIAFVDAYERLSSAP